MIPAHIVTDLCQLGRLGESRSAEAMAILERLAPWDKVNRQRWETWDKVADGLDTEGLINLVRGLLLTEETLRWCGGSVSGVIWTFRALQRRDQQAAGLVAEWGQDRTTNRCVPFRRLSPRELEYRSEASAAARAANRRRNELERVQAIQRRIDRARAVQEHVATTARNAKERADLLKALADLPLPDRLQALLRDQNRSLSWFPETWANEAIGNVAIVDPVLRDELVKRLTGYRKGPWQKLREALLAARRNG